MRLALNSRDLPASASWQEITSYMKLFSQAVFDNMYVLTWVENRKPPGIIFYGIYIIVKSEMKDNYVKAHTHKAESKNLFSSLATHINTSPKTWVRGHALYVQLLLLSHHTQGSPKS